MRHALLSLICIAFLFANGNAEEPASHPYPSEAPIIDGFNDPNAIRYDAAHEAEMEQMDNGWVVSNFDDKYGYAATVNIGGVDRRIEKDLRYFAGDTLPLGTRFREESLVRFLDRRANGDLREGHVKSKFFARDVRAVIEICAEAEIKSATPAMLKLLDDPNEDIQKSAYHLIARVGHDDPAVFEALSKALAQGRMIPEIAHHMHCFGPRGLPVLLKALEKHPDPTGIVSLLYFEHVDWKEAIAVLTTLLEVKDEAVQRSAALVLGDLGAQAESAIPALIKLHAAGRTYSACFGYFALAKMSAKARDAMLADARLPGGDYATAIEALRAEWPDGPTSPIVIDALHHPDANVRAAAARTLWGRGASAAVPALITCLDDPDVYVQSAAAVTLGEIGRGAKSALPALKAAADRNAAAYSAMREIEADLEH